MSIPVFVDLDSVFENALKAARDHGTTSQTAAASNPTPAMTQAAASDTPADSTKRDIVITKSPNLKRRTPAG